MKHAKEKKGLVEIKVEYTKINVENKNSSDSLCN